MTYGFVVTAFDEFERTERILRQGTVEAPSLHVARDLVAEDGGYDYEDCAPYETAQYSVFEA